MRAAAFCHEIKAFICHQCHELAKKGHVLRESVRAARYEPKLELDGWVSRDGRLYRGSDAERMAKWAGSTHFLCECGQVESKGYTCCHSCREARQQSRYHGFQRMKWDGKTPLYSQAWDEYIFDCPFEFAEENGVTIQELQLLICKPNHFHHIDSSHWEDCLPEDEYDLPPEMEAAVDALNAVIDKMAPASWYAGNIVPIIENA